MHRRTSCTVTSPASSVTSRTRSGANPWASAHSRILAAPRTASLSAGRPLTRLTPINTAARFIAASRCMLLR